MISVQAAVPAVGPGVVERPIPVNKSEDNLPIGFSKQAVAREQCFGESAEPVNEILLAFAIVMEMDLDVGDPIRRHPCKRIQETRSIFFFGIEKCITRGLAGRIPELCSNGRPKSCPPRDALRAGIFIGLIPEGLIVIGKKQPDPLRALTCKREEAIFYVRGKPDLAVSGKCDHAFLGELKSLSAKPRRQEVVPSGRYAISGGASLLCEASLEDGLILMPSFPDAKFLRPAAGGFAQCR